MDLDYRGRGAYVPMIFKDERDPDPSRRYKALVQQRGNTLHYSPDGILWSTEQSRRSVPFCCAVAAQ